MTFRTPAMLLMLGWALAVPAAASSGTAKTTYEHVLEREQSLRSGDQPPTVAEIRSVVNAYIALVRRYPASGYSDNELWQAGNLAALAFERFGEPSDREAARRYFMRLRQSYPSSSLRSGADQALRAMDEADAASRAPAPVPAAMARPDQ